MPTVAVDSARKTAVLRFQQLARRQATNATKTVIAVPAFVGEVYAAAKAVIVHKQTISASQTAIAVPVVVCRSMEAIWALARGRHLGRVIVPLESQVVSAKTAETVAVESAFPMAMAQLQFAFKLRDADKQGSYVRVMGRAAEATPHRDCLEPAMSPASYKRKTNGVFVATHNRAAHKEMSVTLKTPPAESVRQQTNAARSQVKKGNALKIQAVSHAAMVWR